MIITLSLNPAVDKTIEIHDFKLNSVNRVSSARLDAGGKGINVSKMIDQLGGRSTAIGVLAGSSGRYIKEQLDLLNIENEFIFVEGETRTNIKIVDSVNGLNTDINEGGPHISDKALDEVLEKAIEAANEKTILVLAGSVPANVRKDIYKRMIAAAKSKGAKTILDADGDLLRQGLEAGPYMIKPNIHELGMLFNKEISNTQEAIVLAKELFSYGVEVIVISLGSEGSVLMTKEKTLLVDGLKVEVISTVGAGDAMVASLALAIERRYSLEDAIILATAASAASVMTPGTSPGELKVIEELKNRVSFKYTNC